MLYAREKPEKKNPRRAEDKGLEGAKDLIIKGDRLKHARHMMMIMNISMLEAAVSSSLRGAVA